MKHKDHYDDDYIFHMTFAIGGADYESYPDRDKRYTADQIL